MKARFLDILNLGRKLSPARVRNGFINYSSYLRSRAAKAVYHPGLPISIAIEPTTSCNLRCPECPSGLRSFTRPTGMLDQQLFHKVIDELAPTLTYLTFYFQGEPYLNPKFLDLVKYASQKRIYTATSTNAHYLDEKNAVETVQSGLDRLIVSIDGTTQETYSSYRIGGNLHKVLEGTRNVLKAKEELKSRTPHVIFQFLVVKPNQHQIDEVKSMGRALGVDEVKFKTAQIYDYEDGNDLIPTLDEYSRYRELPNGKFEIKSKLLDHCWRMWQSCVITWDGKVVPCCFDKDAHYILGDCRAASFKEIWNGAAYQQFRKSLLKSRSEIEMCRNCTEGTKVWA